MVSAAVGQVSASIGRRLGALLCAMQLRGEGAWESNPPGRLVTPHNGFEDRASHRTRSAPKLTPDPGEARLTN